MYRYVETENGELVSGTTSRSIKSMKHLAKVGKVKTVKGYTYWSTRKGFSCNHTAVAVVGDNGRVRLEGLCWGYAGEGPRGLQSLFDLLGIDENATTVAPSPSNQQTKVYWSIDVENQSVED